MFTFDKPEVAEILTKQFIPVAVDIWYYEHVQHKTGDFYRKIVSQREGMSDQLEANKTTQGFYIFDSDGKLYEGWNSRGSETLLQKLRKTLGSFKNPAAAPEPGEDPEQERRPPRGSVVIDTFCKITEASYASGKVNPHTQAFRDSTGRDHLWITKGEANSVMRGKLQKSLVNRIVRFHLNDFTRGEPDMWALADIQKADLALVPEGRGYRLTGDVALSADRGRRGYVAQMFGIVETDGSRITRFDAVAKGRFHGEGKFTKNAPPGEFTLVVAFRLATGNVASLSPPQGIADFGAYLKD